jgi:hypothetical protein
MVLQGKFLFFDRPNMKISAALVITVVLVATARPMENELAAVNVQRHEGFEAVEANAEKLAGLLGHEEFNDTVVEILTIPGM